MSRDASPSAALDRQCVDRLKPIRFGLYSSSGRIMTGIEAAMGKGMELSARQRLAMYAICWRYRVQIGDPKFTAQVLIVERVLVEHADVAELQANNVAVRAWRATAAALSETGGLGL